MSDASKGRSAVRTAGTFLLCCVIVSACVCVVAVISLRTYLQTDHAASLLSEKLTSYLHQPARVAGLHAAGSAIRFTGVSLANPPGLPAGNLVSVDSIVVAPNWRALLTGRPTLRSIALEGLRVDLAKSSAGVWNYAGLQRRFGAKKTEGKELFIEEFVLKDGSFQVNGQGVTGITIRLFNLATKGSQNADIILSFEDVVRNAYTVSGTARPGPEPAFDLSLTAPALSLDRLAGLRQWKNNPFPEGSNGSLKLTAGLQEGRINAAARLDLSRTAAAAPSGTLPLIGSIAAKAAYTVKTDELSLESLDVAIDKLMKGHAAGTITRVRSERSFAGAFEIEELNLAALTFLLPEKDRLKTSIGGSLRLSEFRFSGAASQGLSTASGLITMTGASFERGGQPYVKGLNSRVTVTRGTHGFIAKGAMSQGETKGAVLESLQAPFEILLSRRLKPLTAGIPALSARVAGIAISGRFGYNAAVPAPFTVDLWLPAVQFSDLQHLPEKLKLQLTSGRGSLDLKGKGRGPRDFTATTAARVATVEGKRAETRFGIKNGEVDSRIIRSNGQFDVCGEVRFSGLSFDKKEGDARFAYRLADGTAFLENAAFSFAGTTATIARLKALLPLKESGAATTRYPLMLEVSGGELRRGKLALNGFSGTARGSYLAAPQGRWLEGTADLAIGQVLWQEQTVAAPAAHFAFSRTGGRGSISGALLEGALSGEIGFNPLALLSGGAFQLRIKGGHLAKLGTLLPRRTATLSNGRVDATFSGTYAGRAGLDCRFGLEGSDIALTGNGGKTLVSGGGVNLAGSLSGSDLVVDKAVISAGKEVTLKVQGAVADTFSPQRHGTLTFSLPRTALNSIIDPFVNILPRPIQEATVDGSLASEGKLALHEGRQLLDGSLQLKGVLLEVPSQKFRTAAINGRVPFSLDLSGKSPVTIKERADFSRESYPGLLQQLGSGADTGETVTIGSVEFGSLNLGDVLLQISSGNGVTRIDSLRAKLYEGSLFGSGFVAIDKGVSYRADLLVNGFSLKKFCEAIPKIKDYISGRLDGVISLKGGGKNVAGLVGFTDLWVREDSGEKMLVSKDFLQKLSGKKLSGVFFSADRPYDRAEVAAVLEEGYLTFRKLDIVNTNLFGVRDLSVSIAPDQNRIALDHLLNTIKQAAERGKKADGESRPAASPEFKWEE
jgi:uncharacterized protein involved in outer membrane biogenesis